MASLKPVFALVDCNNFFVSCERVFRPDLTDKPVAVLSNNDGCIVARSNEVKALGVPMGIPYFKVKDTLQSAGVTLFSGNFSLYGDFSQRVVAMLTDVCPRVEVYSVDESFLRIEDLGIKDYQAWGQQLAENIYKSIGIPVSVGIATSKTLAKACADYAKKHPETNGSYSVVGNEPVRVNLLKNLSVGDVWGIGWRSTPKLKAIGVSTAYDFARLSDEWLLNNRTINGLKTARELRGEPCFQLDDDASLQKSIIRSRSFGHRVSELHELEAAVATFAAQGAQKLRRQGGITGAVMTYIYSSKHDKERRGGSQVVRLPLATSETGKIITAALQALRDAFDGDVSYKKAGIVLLDIKPKQALQLTFDSSPSKIDDDEKLMQTIDQLNKRFKTRLVRHASEQPGLNTWRSNRKLKSPGYTTSWQDLPVVK